MFPENIHLSLHIGDPSLLNANCPFSRITDTKQHKIQTWLTRKDFQTKIWFDKM